MPYEFLPHTADLAVRVWADTLPALFGESARAFTASFTDPGRVTGAHARLVSVEAADLEVLFHDFLSELLSLCDTQRWLVASAEAWMTSDGGTWRLDAHLCGEPFDVARHPVTTRITAVTFRDLTVTRTDDGWQALVVLDT